MIYKRVSICAIPLLLALAFLYPPAAQKSILTAYNPVDFGAVNDANPANAATNATAIQAAINACASTTSPGYVYIPPGPGFCVQNGVITVSSANTVIRGDASMGAGAPEAPTSRLIPIGRGHTITVPARGCLIQGLAFQDHSHNEQQGGEAFILLQGTHTTVKDCHLGGPNVGISIQTPINDLGEFWVRDVLIENYVGTAGVVANAGNCTVQLSHVIMYSDPQPPYGILVQAAGELVIDNGCDIICMGTMRCSFQTRFSIRRTVLVGFTSARKRTHSWPCATSPIVGPARSTTTMGRGLATGSCSTALRPILQRAFGQSAT